MLVTRERTFTALNSENFGRIYRYIAYCISDADRAEELAGDVFRIAWEKELPEEPGIGWLIAAARNVVANEYKGRHRQQLLREGLQDRVRIAAASNDNESDGHRLPTRSPEPSRTAGMPLHRTVHGSQNAAPPSRTGVAGLAAAKITAG